jgi:hypothetical protein
VTLALYLDDCAFSHDLRRLLLAAGHSVGRHQDADGDSSCGFEGRSLPVECSERQAERSPPNWPSSGTRAAEGTPEADLLAAYPQLQPEDIRAALAYAAEMTCERIIPIPVGTGRWRRYAPG